MSEAAQSKINKKKLILEIAVIALIVCLPSIINFSSWFLKQPIGEREKYDDEIWQANFEKNYNGIYNKYESVKVYFIPENDEIVALTVFNEAPTNSSVTISEEDAILTAANSLDVSSSEIVSATLSMEKSESDESIHPSWVVQASNNSIVFVDANNNAVIGGDSINE